MRKSPPNRSNPSQSGFTLIELLVVIAIIGILATLLFPAVTKIRQQTERTFAQNTAYNLKNAISTYYTEYRKYPVEADKDEGQAMRTNHELMDVLLGADDSDLNPRKIAFYTGKAAKPMGGGKYRKGITLDSDGGGELWDPWGEYYYVQMDLDYNNRVQKPQWDEKTEGDVLPESILVWSSGADMDESNDTGDGQNPRTW